MKNLTSNLWCITLQEKGVHNLLRLVKAAPNILHVTRKYAKVHVAIICKSIAIVLRD